MAQASMQSLLFVGLGNPGSQYEMTRHNIGFQIIQVFANKLGWMLKQDRRFNARAARGVIGEESVHLLLPLTYMNLSGEAVRRYVDYFKIPPGCILVVADDIALPFGKLRLKPGGGSGGHKGFASIAASLGTSDFKRLRIGIGHPGEQELADYVLEAFSHAEQQELPALIESGVQTLQHLLKESFSLVMNSVNKHPLT